MKEANDTDDVKNWRFIEDNNVENGEDECEDVNGKTFHNI